MAVNRRWPSLLRPLPRKRAPLTRRSVAALAADKQLAADLLAVARDTTQSKVVRGRAAVAAYLVELSVRLGGVGLPRAALYGRWCGKGHGGGAPVDAIDAACMRHDKAIDALAAAA